MNILFLTRTLNLGGAERQLVNLAKGLKQRGHIVSVVVFYSGGVLCQELDDTGIPVLSLEKKYRWDIFSFFLSLIRIVRKVQPQLVHSYGGVPNCFAQVLKLFQHNIKVVWGVRASFLDLSQYDIFIRILYKLECALSKYADLIIFNSKAGRSYALSKGFSNHNMKVIFNGINTDIFKPNIDARMRLREQWNVDDSVQLVGFIGRLDPMKDHMVFIDAMSHVCDDFNKIVAVCIGSGSPDYLEQLKIRVSDLGLKKQILWQHSRQDIADCINAFDIFVSSSYGEGFPNVIGEAMACGVPCVVTDVGDSAHVVGNYGIVVPPKNSEKLAKGVIKMIDRISGIDWVDKTYSPRQRVVNCFSIKNLVDNTEVALKSIV